MDADTFGADPLPGWPHAGHVERWPGWPQRHPSKTLGLLEWPFLTLETGDRLVCRDYRDLVEMLFSYRVDCYVFALLDVPDLVYDACQDRRATVRCSKTGGPTLIRWRGGQNRTVTLAAIEAWASVPASLDGIKALRTLFDACEVGDWPTPGALGTAMQQKSIEDQGLRPFSRPPKGCLRDIWTNSVGARADCPAVGEVFEHPVWQYDIRMAYAKFCERLPDGAPLRYLSTTKRTVEDMEGVTWYARCVIQCERPISFSPFATVAVDWKGRKTKRLVWRLDAGTYNRWLWREEAERAVAAGCRVDVYEGWAWDRWTDALAPWGRQMHALRSQTPSAAVANLVKQTTVAAIGRHGMQPGSHELHYLADGEGERDDDISIIHGSTVSRFVARKIRANVAGWQAHWNAYVVMCCRVALYDRAMSEMRSGNRVLSLDTDSVYVEFRSKLPVEPDVLGGWQEKRLTPTYLRDIKQRGVRFKQPRWVECKEKIRRPGVAKVGAARGPP